MGEWADRWLAGQAHLKPTTRERYAGIVRKHIRPRWGTTRLADVTHADVQAWVTKLGRNAEPATVRKIHRVLSLILTLAVRDGRLIRNPAADVKLPRPQSREQRYLTHEQVHELARAAAGPAYPSKHRRLDERQHDQYRLIVLFLAYTGVRFGEMAALRVRRVDFLRRRAMIAESVTLVGSTQVWGTPKGHEKREVPIPRFLIEQLAEHVRGKSPDELAFAGVHDRVRHDRIDESGVVTLRIAGRLHHIGIGRTHARTHVILLAHDLHVRVVHAATGELLRDLIVDPNKDYQPQPRSKPTS